MAHPLLSRRAFSALAFSAGAVGVARPSLAQTTLQISTVNYPLAYFSERLTDGFATVSFPVPPGVDPSFWRPSISEISAFQASDLIVLNGAGFADWTSRVSLPRSRLVNTSAGFEDAYIATETVTHSHGDGGEHSHTGTASYVWLDFAQAIQQAEAIATALVRVAPDRESEIAANLTSLAAELTALDNRARDISSLAAGATAIASHPRYQYFERAYGFDIQSMDWDPNESPTEAQWRDLQALVQSSNASIFIWEAQPTPEAVAQMSGHGLASAVFSPAANRPEAGDFLETMRAGLDQVQRAFGEAV